MRTLAFVVVLAHCVLTSHEAAAQGFFYAPPGSGYGDFYGGNLGNGVGVGYGVGVTLSPGLLNSSVTDTYIPPFQELCDSNPSFILRGAAVQSQTPVPKKTAMVTATKKSVPKVKPSKVKTTKQGAAKAS